ncbi:hypothetical protein ISN45_Aa05g002820 [Arabidopsis thaliana x Arabidopsis arenosa]|uniref:F-box domain-containing protein n=1 Tax=Arabidopsis thaliana x Arabidopsis arenosa TaxID=1240361 RepID=A0A8T1ZGR9_9BRAS|nr:hypothetical protein ISN45_Aa05g002820 [Arabidopsis thaliana x Arabidopsis arenosa]
MSENQDWSNLCHDLLRPILESLSTIDFHRAKTVCSDWYSVWKTCVKRPLCPWQITHQGNSMKLFDPKEDKIHKIAGLSDFSYYMASYGNWLLMVHSGLDFYILNLLTCKRINLPSITHRSIVGFERSAVLWINERTEDYFVAFISNQHYLFSHKKGDDKNMNWNLYDTKVGLFDMAYKNSNLYLYTLDHDIKILDFSGDFPKVEGMKNPYRVRYFVQPLEYIWKRKIVIPNSGEVLIILSLKKEIHEKKFLFYIFKMNLESSQWERVYSIGENEMIIFGHGVTIRAPVQDVGDGIKSDSICFVENDLWPDWNRPSSCGIFDLATSTITWPKRFGVHIDQWFIPGSA